MSDLEAKLAVELRKNDLAFLRKQLGEVISEIERKQKTKARLLEQIAELEK